MLGSFADLEWLGDLCWNMGCILVSDTHAHSIDVFDNILLSTSDRSSNAAPKEEMKLEIGRYSANYTAGGKSFIYCSHFLTH